MTEWITSSVNEAAAGIWAKVVYFVTFQFLDPFYGWLSLGCLTIAAIVVVVWFFGDWIKQLKPIGGALVLIIAAMLFAYRRGEKEAREHDAKKGRR